MAGGRRAGAGDRPLDGALEPGLDVAQEERPRPLGGRREPRRELREHVQLCLEGLGNVEVLAGPAAPEERLAAGTGSCGTAATVCGTPLNADVGTTTVTIQASDGTNTVIDSFDIAVAAFNDAPTFTEGASTTRNIDENTASGTNIGNAVSATDVDDTTLTYSIPSTGDAASFTIVSTSGQLQTDTDLNFESDSSYSFDVTITDSGGGKGSGAELTDTITVTISISDVDDVSVWSGDTTGAVTEDDAITTATGTVSISDTDGGDSPTITAQTDTAGTHGSFSITTLGAWT